MRCVVPMREHGGGVAHQGQEEEIPMHFKITVLSDPDVPEPMLIEVFDMASGPHCQDLGKALVDLTEARTGVVTVEIERVA